VPAIGATAPPAGAARGELAAREPSKTVRYALYKFMQRIGIERDTYTPTTDGGTEAKAIFSFQDRGSPVPLSALYRLAPDGSPLRYQAWGNTARGTSIDDRVVARGGGGFDVFSRARASAASTRAARSLRSPATPRCSASSS
jgi:hypothetical protein